MANTFIYIFSKLLQLFLEALLLKKVAQAPIPTGKPSELFALEKGDIVDMAWYTNAKFWFVYLSAAVSNTKH